jgi:capsular polysaccharide biosynthesis protein
MERHEIKREEYYMIDLRHVIMSLWKRMWVMALASLLAAGVCWGYATYGIAPTYSAHIKLYVNNGSVAKGDVSISNSELIAAQSLVKTYGEILNSHRTLERVAEKAGVSEDWEAISAMLSYAPSNETEVMQVTVTCTDPYKARDIANAISEVLPLRVNEIVEGSSMKVVDDAIPRMKKVGPDVTRYTLIGLAVGFIGSALLLLVAALIDDTIHDEDYLLKYYDYPILGKIPDLLDTGNKSSGQYSRSNRSGRSTGRKG